MSQEHTQTARVGIAGSEGFGADALAVLLNARGYAALRVVSPSEVVGCALVIITGDSDYPTARAIAQTAAETGTATLGVGEPTVPLAGLVPEHAWIPTTASTEQLMKRITTVTGWHAGHNGNSAPHNGVPLLGASGQRRLSTVLSERERESVIRYVSGMTVREVSAELGVATTTVSTHLDRARSKYAAAGRDASNKLGLLMRALEDGLLPCPCAREDFDSGRLVTSR
jgi:DNA-binding CsgD family transcriptional regulator